MIARMHVCMYAHMQMHVRKYARMHACMHASVNVSICTRMHIRHVHIAQLREDSVEPCNNVAQHLGQQAPASARHVHFALTVIVMMRRPLFSQGFRSCSQGLSHCHSPKHSTKQLPMAAQDLVFGSPLGERNGRDSLGSRPSD